MKKLFLLLLWPTILFAQVRIYSAGSLNLPTYPNPYTDSQGHNWIADTGFYTGTTSLSVHAPTVTGALPSSTDQALYVHPRAAASSMTVTFPNVAAGTYTLTLKLSEVYYTAVGQRIMNVTVNGQPWLTNFDIVATTGGYGVATDQSMTVTVPPVATGTPSVVLVFTSVKGGACYEGISLLPTQVTTGFNIVFTWNDSAHTPLTSGGASYSFVPQQAMDSTGTNWNNMSTPANVNLDVNGLAKGTMTWNSAYPATFKFNLWDNIGGVWFTDQNGVAGLQISLSPVVLNQIGTNNMGLQAVVRFNQTNNALAYLSYCTGTATCP